MDRLTQLLAHLEEDPKDDFLLFAVAKEYEKRDQFETAETWFLRLQEQSSDYIGLYYNLGKLYERMDRIQDALRIYSEGLVLAKNTNDFHAASELNTAKMNLEIEL